MSQNKTPSENKELAITAKLLTIASANTTASLDKFSGWMLAGFGAVFALLLANINPISEFLNISAIKTGIMLYLVALTVGIFQKYMATIVASGCSAGKEAEKIGGQFDNEINLNTICESIEQVTFYPQKWIVKKQFDKLKAGDYAIAGRTFAKLTQIRGLLVFAQTVIMITSIVVVIYNLK